jgi:hypothetical protein
MSNRFHNKWHRKNHHTYGNASNPDASHDPIASSEQPFLGDFVLQGALCAVAPMSAFGAYIFSNYTALCAFAGYKAIRAKSFGFPGLDSIGIEVDAQNIAISAHGVAVGLNVHSPVRAISAYSRSIAIESYGHTFGNRVYSNSRAISAYGSYIGAEIYSPTKAISAFGENIGIEVYSPQRALSAYGNVVAGEFYSPQKALSATSPVMGLEVYSGTRAISAYGRLIGAEIYSPYIAISSYSPNLANTVYSNRRAISAYGTLVAGEFYSPQKAISATSPVMGLEVYSNTRAISAYSKFLAIETYGEQIALSAMSPHLAVTVYSNNRALSAFGTNIGAEIASPNVAISAYSPKVAIRAFAPIYTQNNDGVRALDVRGFSFFDGDVTISGNLTAAGALTYLDTRVQITSSLYVKNSGTDLAFTVIQQGNTDIVNIQDDEATAFYIENGGNVGIGTNAPAANLHVVDIRNDSDPEVRIQARTSNAFDPTLRLIGTGSTSDGLTVRYDSNVGDVYFNNGATPSNNIAYRVSTAADTDSVVVFNTGNVGINATTPIAAAKLNIAGDSSSSNIALSASAPTLAASFYSPIMGLSANGSNIGAIIRSPNLALRVTGGVEINNNSAEAGAGYPVNINSIHSVGNVNIGNSTGNLVLSGNRFDLRTENPVFINTDAGEIFNLNTGTGAETNINTGSGTVTTTIGNAGTVNVNGATLNVNSTQINLGDAATDTVTINAGPVNIPNATTAADALILGGDVNLYRSAANTLRTDDSLSVLGDSTTNGNSFLSGSLYVDRNVRITEQLSAKAIQQGTILAANANTYIIPLSAEAYQLYPITTSTVIGFSGMQAGRTTNVLLSSYVDTAQAIGPDPRFIYLDGRPTSLPAGKVLLFEIISFGTALSSVVIKSKIQP